MPMAFKMEQLRSMTDDELIELHDKTSENVVVGLNYLLDELRRREQLRAMKTSEKLARASLWLAGANTIAAGAAVVIALVQ